MTSLIASCRACGGDQAVPFGPDFSAPLSTAGWPRSAQEATGMAALPIRLVRCILCGHVHNILFDQNAVPSKANLQMYNQGDAWTVFLNAQVQRLAAMAEPGATVLDIGCGDCGFLNRLRHIRPDLHLVGVDPAAQAQEGIEVFTRRFESDDLQQIRPDLILLRHILEHLERPRNLLEILCAQSAIHDLKPLIYAEVPALDGAIREHRVADLLYEHGSHFTEDSFAALWRTLPLTLTKFATSADGELVWALAHLTQGETLRSRMAEAKRFGEHTTSGPATIRAQLVQAQANGQRVVIWGGTGKAAAFLNRVHCPFAHVVDSDPSKVGGWVPGTGQAIESPAIIEDGPPTVIVVPSKWRLADICAEIARRPITLEALLVEEGGRLRAVEIKSRS
jgi:hypothetical protein